MKCLKVFMKKQTMAMLLLMLASGVSSAYETQYIDGEEFSIVCDYCEPTMLTDALATLEDAGYGRIYMDFFVSGSDIYYGNYDTTLGNLYTMTKISRTDAGWKASKVQLDLNGFAEPSIGSPYTTFAGNDSEGNPFLAFPTKGSDPMVIYALSVGENEVKATSRYELNVFRNLKNWYSCAPSIKGSVLTGNFTVAAQIFLDSSSDPSADYRKMVAYWAVVDGAQTSCDANSDYAFNRATVQNLGDKYVLIDEFTTTTEIYYPSIYKFDATYYLDLKQRMNNYDAYDLEEYGAHIFAVAGKSMICYSVNSESASREYQVSYLPEGPLSFANETALWRLTDANTTARQMESDLYYYPEIYGGTKIVSIPVSEERTDLYVLTRQTGLSHYIVTHGKYDINTGAGEISVANTDLTPEYYNLQGVRVALPSDGLYIVRRGEKVSKEYIR